MPDEDRCFVCDGLDCDYTDSLGMTWHWHCFTDLCVKSINF